MKIEELKKEYAEQDKRCTAFPIYVQVQELVCIGVMAGGNAEEVDVGYIWHPVEFFLTIKGAEEYMKANKHNHGKLRTYVSHFERRNFEMRGLLKNLGFKTQD